MVAGIGLKKLAQVVRAYPTQAEAIRMAADNYNETRLTPLRRRLHHERHLRRQRAVLRPYWFLRGVPHQHELQGARRDLHEQRVHLRRWSLHLPRFWRWRPSGRRSTASRRVYARVTFHRSA